MLYAMEPVIFFSSPPAFEDLCAATVFVVKSTQHIQGQASQSHVLKCRELIFSEPNVIASPSYDLDSCFNIIMQQSLWKTGRLQGRLQKMGLEFTKPSRVHPTMYQSCLRYTIIAKMAPSWNKAGEWYIQGRDFVFHHGYASAIKTNLHVSKTEIYIAIYGTVVRFPPLQVDDLNLSRHEMLKILQSTQEDGKEVELQDSWCHVLPSMKRARIVSVSLTIPSESPFTCYKDLKRYWKNMYGYRLPETDEDILYCQILFLSSECGKQFTYPDVCLRKKPAQQLKRMDSKPILTSFLQDIHSKIGHICGQPLRFQPKMHYADVSLHDAKEDILHASLTNKKKTNGNTNLKHPQVVLQKNNKINQDPTSLQKKLNEFIGQDYSTKDKEQKQEKITSSSEKPDQHSSNHHKQSKSQQTNTDGSHSKMKEISSRDEQCESNQGISKPHMKPPQQNNNQTLLDVNAKVESDFSSNFQTKFVPIFRSKQKPMNKGATQHIENKLSTPKFTPMFKSKVQSSYATQMPVSTSDQTMCPKLIFSSASQPDTVQPRLFPVFRPKQKGTPNIYKSSNQTSKTFTVASISKTMKLPSHGKVISNGILSTIDSDIQTQRQVMAAEQVHNKFKSVLGTPTSKKRKPDQNKTESDTPKKLRPKPQMQKLDIEALAKSNELKKANTLTLMTWLKERGINCRSKDNKNVLIEKIITHINKSSVEP